MIKAILKTQDPKKKDVLLLGVDKINIQRLVAGEMIKVDGSEVGISHDILIMYGDTRKDILKEIDPMIRTETKIHIGKGAFDG